MQLADLPDIPADVRVLEADTKYPATIYTPGAGNLFHVGGSPVDEVAGVNMRQLSWLLGRPTHPLMELVDVECSKPLYRPVRGGGYEPTGNHCTATIRVSRMFAAASACDSCRAAWEERERMERARYHWEKICPARYREHDQEHACFARAQWKQLQAWSGGTSLFFYGPKRTGKTHLAMMMLKRALVRGGKSVGILWPEKLERINPRFEKEDPVELWGRYDVLLLDDALITAKSAQQASFLKNLIDYLMRHGRRFIITSQVGGDDYIEHIKSNGSRVEEDTAEALIGRIREECPAGSGQQVSFAAVLPPTEIQEEF